MKNKIRIITAVIMVLLIAVSSSCSSLDLDVVKNDSIRAFNDVLIILPAKGNIETGWSVTSPDDKAKFKLDNQNFALIIDAQPFVDAGLDLTRLDNANMDDNTIIYLSPGFNMLNDETPDSAQTQFEKNINSARDLLNYHIALDHYGIKIGNGNMFEWAKDLSDNDKDIVFVLNPQPLAECGVDPEKIDGWLYTQVQVEENGKKSDEWRLLKYFNLK